MTNIGNSFQNMLEKMQQQEFRSKTMLCEVHEIDGATEEFRPATNDMFEYNCKYIFHIIASCV